MLRARWAILVVVLLGAAQEASAQRLVPDDGRRLIDGEPPPAIASTDFSAVAIDPKLQQLVDQLASEDYARREEAMNALFEVEFDRRQVYAILAQQDLSAEQRHRLLSCVIVQLLNMPRGAVGISMRWVTEAFGEPGYVLVERTIPGFDAAQMLQFHDRITHVDHEPLLRDGDFARLVQSKRPGEKVALTLDRAKRGPDGELVVNADGSIAYETLEVAIKLGSLDELREMPGDNRVVDAGNDALSSEMRWALSRFGSPRRTIAVDGELPQPAMAETAISPIDAHPDIELLRQQIEALDSGRIRNVDSMQRTWQRRLNQLFEEAREPELSEEERVLRVAVAERYLEILAEAMAPRATP